MAYLIKDAFVMKGVFTMKLDELLNHLEKKSGYVRDSIVEMLKEYNDKVEDFIKIYDLNSFTLVKIDRSFSMQTIIINIEKEFK